MLDSFRSSKSNVFFWAIIALLIVGLAGFGIGSSGSGGGATELANVGDHSITVDEYAQALNSEQRRFAGAYGRAPTGIEFQALGSQVMGQLLGAASFDGEAERLGISVSDDRVREELMATRAFAGADGSFDRTAYEFALENAGLTPSEYDEVVRSNTSRRILETSIGGGLAYPDTAAEALVGYVSEARGVTWVRLNEASLEEPIAEAQEADLVAQHTDNPDLYTVPERRVITYAAITEEELIDELGISTEELRELYDERSDFYSRPERRIVDRIVFPDAAAATAALARIEDGSAGFDDIAQERGLGAEDIDLGEVTRSDLSEAEEALLFGTQDLGVFGPVASDLGPALYRINATLDETRTPFEEAEEELRDEIGRDQADGMIAEEITLIEDLLAGGATLEEVADETLLNLGTIEMGPDSFDGIAADEAFREEALAAEVGEFRELADLSDGVFVLRIDEIKAPEVLPLEEVRAQVATDWRSAQVASAVEDLSDTLLSELQEGKTLGALASERGLIVTEEAPLDRRGIVEGTTPAFVEALFSNDPGLPFKVVDDMGAILGVVGATEPADLTEESLAQMVTFATQDFRSSVTDDVLTLFARAVQEQGGVSTNRSLMEQVIQQLSGGHP